MLEELNIDKKFVGFKQSLKAVNEGTAIKAFIAEDADKKMTESFSLSCNKKNIPIETVATMKELGAACGISIGTAVAVIVK